MASNSLETLAGRYLGNRTLDPEEAHVLAKILARQPIAQDVADVADARATLGDRLADRVAAVLSLDHKSRRQLYSV